MPTRHFTVLILRWLAAFMLLAAAPWARSADDFLDPDVAFKLSATAADARTVEIHFEVAPGYYLYRERFKFGATGATLGEPQIPPGKTHFDETFQKNVETYHDSLNIRIPVSQAPRTFHLLVTNQGCADKGLCYPPQERALEVRLSGFGGDGSVKLAAAAPGGGGVLGSSDGNGGSVLSGTSVSAAATSIGTTSAGAPPVDDGGIDSALRSGRMATVVGVFLLAGVLLSLTPCVLPMLPILSSIIVGQGGHASRGRGLALAVSYSLGMALVYTAFGVAAGLAGEGLSATLQQPWLLSLFAVGLVLLSLSMFGAYELRLPSAFTGSLTQASQRLPGGRFASVFLMGGVSALICSPCVAAPLAGALVYLSQTRDVWLGGAALFSLAMGMSVPLLLIGASAGALLPRAGGWMEDVKRFFGLMLLGVAVWTLQSVLHPVLSLCLWAVLALGAAFLFLRQRALGSRPSTWTRSAWRQVLAACLVLVAGMEIGGAMTGGVDPVHPMAHWRRNGVDAEAVVFQRVRSVAELDALLQSAGRPVMLDFYADWCVSCKEMERDTFVDAAVRSRLSRAMLLKVDVTANTPDDRALLRRFQLFGPPGTIFFDPKGQEIGGARIAGYQNPQRFLQTLSAAGI